MSDSIRERCVQALVQRFADQVKGAPAGTRDSGELLAYDFGWDCVVRHVLGDMEEHQKYSLAVLETNEVKNDQIGKVNALLDIELQFKIWVDTDAVPAEELNCVLKNIQRQIREDVTLGGLSIDLRETGNTHSVESFEDKQVEGSVFMILQYRHAEDDPREVVYGRVP